ncbi:MAG: T9SS type A sorting domain-containing protein [Ichthyobacteriaceae bacterium]|nr:T9SS type A sorting domain-containing protein [Ichthyobacteriaceae bacterium]
MKKNLLFVAIMLLGMQTMFAQENYVTLDGDTQNFYASNGNDDFDVLIDDYTYEIMVRVDDGAVINDEPLSSSAIMLQKYNFGIFLMKDADSDFAIKYVAFNPSDDHDMDVETLDIPWFVDGSMTTESSAVNLKYGKWFHVAITRSSADNTAKLFVNGKMISSSTDDIWKFVTTPGAPNFGYRYAKPSANYLKGSLDEVRVSKVARYSEDFKINRLDKYPTADENDILILHLDGGEGTTTAVQEGTGSYVTTGGTKSVNLKNITWESTMFTEDDILALATNSIAKFVVYPNPAVNNKVSVQAQLGEAINKVEVLNMVGKTVKVIEVSKKHEVSVALDGLSSGIYFVKVTSNKGVGVKKIII